MRRKRNTEAIIQIGILLFIAVLLLYSMVSEKVNYYVHPRFHIGLWISIFVLLIFALSLVPKVRKARNNVNRLHYLIYVVPLTVAFLFPAAGIRTNITNISMASMVGYGRSALDTKINTKDDSSSEAAGGSWYNNYNTEDSTNPEDINYEEILNQANDDEGNDSSGYLYEEAESFLRSKNIDSLTGDASSEDTSTDNTAAGDTVVEDSTTEAASDYSKNIQGSTFDEDASTKYDTYNDNGVIIIKDDIFSDWFFDVHDNLDAFLGKRYQYLAQVFSIDGLEENQFLAGRSFMVCCAADLEGYGILCESDIRSELKDEDWIMVTGTLDQYEYEGSMLPKLIDVTIEKAKAPEVEYIYYNRN
ncbi:MAG TPA: DUF1980 domain-containing protein [Lachnospiraceae bacterium]|nr:DUF1980 domain-containing protein [Lachnospiraceae bacterium]